MATSNETVLCPVIDGAEQFKYYRVPKGLKEIRSKQKVAIIFGYVGEKYYGLQWNKLANMPTVESALLKALYETDMISLTNFSNIKVQQLLNFERASRTDKGVHALCNVVSVNLMLPYSAEYVSKHVSQQREEHTMQSERNKGCRNASDNQSELINNGHVEKEQECEEVQKMEQLLERQEEEVQQQEERQEQVNKESDIVPMYSCELAKELLNKALPDDIYVYKVTPVTRSFNSYMNCNNREYEYYIPTFAFMNKREYTTQYFTRDVAPERPTLTEIGFKSKHTDSALEDKIEKEKWQLNEDVSTNITEINIVGREEWCCHMTNSNSNSEIKDVFQEEEESNQFHEEPTELLEKVSALVCDEGQQEIVDFKKRRNHGHFPKRKSARKRLRAEQQQQQQQQEQEQRIDDCKAHQERSDLPETENNACINIIEEIRNKDMDDKVNSSDNSENCVDKGEASSDGIKSKQTSDYIMFYSDNLFEPMMLFRSVMESVMRKAAAYRISAEQLTHVRELFKTYEGTHCFHNFTPGGFSSDPSCHRFIREVTVSEPFTVHPGDAMIQTAIDNWTKCNTVVNNAETEHDGNTKNGDGDVCVGNDSAVEHIRNVYGESGLEVVCVKFSGQSFMLNQIRKMIGAVMCMSAADLDANFLKLTLLKKGLRCSVPMAPANGLFLSHLDFGGYNKRLRRIQDDGNNGANKLSICMDAIDSHELTRMREKIVSVVLRNEMANDLIGRWMRSLRQVIRLVWKIDLP